MKEKFKNPSAVMVILERESNGVRETLLQKRQNTGYMDGMWDCAASGHVEENEPMTMTAIREAKEEIGIDVAPQNINFVTMTHRHSKERGATYYDGYFTVNKFSGEVKINEPEKCSDLKWFDIHNLPEDMMLDRKQSVENYLNGKSYDEIGWN